MSTWLRPADHDEQAITRILDAAGELFAADGVLEVGMAEVAAAAGCSRATLYRYVENRHALRVAYVHREARRVGAAVVAEVQRIDDPARRLEEAVLAAVRGVRGTPSLAAWFADASAATATELGAASEVIEALAAAFLGDASDPDTHAAARWVVRIVLSLLTLPGRDADDERAMVRRFLVPAVLQAMGGETT